MEKLNQVNFNIANENDHFNQDKSFGFAALFGNGLKWIIARAFFL